MAGRVQRGGCRCEGYPQNQCPPHNTTRTHAQTAVCHRSVQPLTGKYLRVQRQVLAGGPNLREVGLQETGRGEERKLNIRHRAGGLAGSGAQAQPQRRAPSQWPSPRAGEAHRVCGPASRPPPSSLTWISLRVSSGTRCSDNHSLHTCTATQWQGQRG